MAALQNGFVPRNVEHDTGRSTRLSTGPERPAEHRVICSCLPDAIPTRPVPAAWLSICCLPIGFR